MPSAPVYNSKVLRMLPLLPALLLLIFRGPSVAERPVVGQDLGAKEAVYLRQGGHIRSLLALGRSHAFSRAIVRLLQGMPADLPPKSAEVAVLLRPSAVPVADSPRHIRDAYFQCRRTRDGPGPA